MSVIPRTQGCPVFQSGGGNKGIGHSKSGNEAVLVDINSGSVADIFCQGQKRESAFSKKTSDRPGLWFVPGALDEFHVGDDRNLALGLPSHDFGRSGISPKEPDQYVGIKEHGGAPLSFFA